MLDIDIIDQQPDFLIAYKPAGLSFHSESGQPGLFQQVKALALTPELYPVHRLDKMTSGLIIFATNKNSATEFQQLFEQRNIEKYYLAISDKKPKKKQGLIKGDMEKSRRGMWKLLRSQTNPAISQFFSYSLTEGKRLFIIKPYTGRTHQIRVALASIGSAILGDSYYSKSSSDRGYLHAYALRFTIADKQYQYLNYPHQGQEFTSKACQELLSTTLAAPWQLIWPELKF
ncbi:RNA pseudouridine synthase [Thalassotalea insulae]|uniref:RNA pseudouridine synthase n=1 Tax=Thalassotalea insulae TaxID=2056778 RepID=A0ABQ6GX28_9GAMM|nr:TIGR01621 family pseudouridine synthase [Thalassotalea insulae]GLX79280.1 RNA pseudouridine synthase [Thalassotalea insulae]